MFWESFTVEKVEWGGSVEEQSVVGFEVMALNTNNILRSSKKFINSPNSVLARNVWPKRYHKERDKYRM